MSITVTPLRLRLPSGASVSAIFRAPEQPRACFVFAHGAGAGMDHPFMTSLTLALESRDIATLRFQFPFMELGSKRPDTPAIAHQAIRVAVAEATALLPGVPLYAGGKSFGGRMSSQAHSASPLPNVQGLIFVGFPLHAAGQLGTSRADHLQEIKTPMLFLQGTRDGLADQTLIQNVACGLAPMATLKMIEGADHAFHVLVRSGRTDAQVVEEIADQIALWVSAVNS